MKRFKDPIYGYIDIDDDIVTRIIDTPEFQRLRYIRQTSYLPVYSAALHNRFIHSLGVYFLGMKAYNSINKNSPELFKKYNVKDKIGETFQLACLLHDVGHSPFSHTGERFYIDNSNNIYTMLKDEVGDSSFSEDMDYYHENAKQAAPHEIMSAIVGLVRFKQYFQDSEMYSFFARCITGYKYRDVSVNILHSIYNSFITLLNSSTIDVDRLDYLIRDAFVMGYNSISIDYDRLLGSLTLIEFEQESSSYPIIQLAYRKSALSVIENVIYAHDSEKKWIQNHPVILYEVFLISQIITSVRADYRKRTGKELFSLESLLPAEKEKDNENYKQAQLLISKIIEKINKDDKKQYPSLINNLQKVQQYIESLDLPITISSLCDDDIIYIAKQINSCFCEELLNRNVRRHPVWKSESEYRVCVDGYIGDATHSMLYSQINLLYKFQNEESPSHCIDSEAIQYCEKCLENIRQSTDLSDLNKQDMKYRYDLLLKWLHGLKEIAKEHNLDDWSFVIYPTSKFESSFKKQDLAQIPIFFPETNKTYPLEDLISLFSVKNEKRHEFFYIYYKRNNAEKLDAFKIGKEIAKIALEGI